MVDVYSLTSTSNVYFVQESYDGYYQIYFGNDVLGTQPTNGKVIELDYFIGSSGSLPNGCLSFTFNGSFNQGQNVTTTTEQVSFGGSQKESIESIKFNAVRSNASKGRIVTTNDYALEIATQFPFVKSTSVWGGEENVPPIYGKVFIGIQPVDGYTIPSDVKHNTIIPALRKKSMMTIIPELVDPYYTFIEFTSNLKFDVSKSSRTKETVQYLVSEVVRAYLESISKFDSGDFVMYEITLFE